MIGNFVDDEPNEKAVNASLQVIEYVKSIQNNLENDYEFITHGDASDNPGAATLCPGKELYAIWKNQDDFVNQTNVCKCTTSTTTNTTTTTSTTTRPAVDIDQVIKIKNFMNYSIGRWTYRLDISGLS